MKKQNLRLLFFLLMVLSLSLGLGAIDFGWMQPGVRVWYFGGTSGLSGANAVEAYLINAIADGNVNYICHSASEFWTSPKPVGNLVASLNMGAFWIHPAVLQTIAVDDFWEDQQILTVKHTSYTYDTLLADMGAPYNLLPSRALFDIQAQRQIVKITYTFPNTYSIGRAFLDADTGLALCRDMILDGYMAFFILGEINYDFARHVAFAEDDGPHCGFKSRVAENALAGGGHAGGIVDIQSGIETRYGNKVEMWVQSTFNGPLGLKMATENYYFDGQVPIVRRINHDNAGDLPPDQWNPFGQYLPWWLPAAVTQGGALSPVSLALSTINVYDVSMTKTADQPLTYTATQNPQQFYFSTLWFDSTGYLTLFSAIDPTIGLDIDGNSIFGNATMVYGLSYYLNTMQKAIPVIRKDDFLGTWDGQGVYYRNSETGKWTKLGSPANLIAAGDLEGDGKDELICVFPSPAGLWVRFSSTGKWTKFASASAKHIASGDMNGDARVDLLATWDGQGVFYRNSISGAWVKIGSPANLITAGDLDGDNKGDLICVFPSPAGVWARFSKTGKWVRLSSTSARDMACGDMNGDGRDDFLATWDGQGIFYRNSISGLWVKMGQAAEQVTAGDLDGDGVDDLIGLFTASGGVYVKYSKTGKWAKLGNPVRDMATGVMRGAIWGGSQFGFLPLDMPLGGYAEGPGSPGNFKDKSELGPGGWRFAFQVEKNLIPQNSGEALAIPGPGDPGFVCTEQDNLFPQEQEKAVKESRERESQNNTKRHAQ